MKNAGPSFKEDLLAPLSYALALQVAIALAYIVPVESSPVLSLRKELRLIEAVLFLTPLITVWINSINEKAARWFAVLLPGVLVVALYVWLGSPGLLTLLALPVAMAAAFIGLPAATGMAVLASLTLLGLPAVGVSVDAPQLLIAFSAVATIYAMTAAILRPVHAVASWSWEYYQQGKQLSEETRQQRGELEQALADLEHANRQMLLLYEKQTALQRIAEEARRTKSAFVAKVSHEFRTPLNMIIGLAGVMIENPQMYGRSLPQALVEDLRVIERNCEHLSSLVNDVLALSQAQAGQLALHREPIDINELINSAIGVVRPLLDKKKLYLETQLPPYLPEISADRTRIRQVVLNLLSNAARFTDQGGITVRVEEQENHLQIEVADTGPGIAQEDIERIFEPFCQGSTEGWKDKGGSGLGLTISKQFVELHGGRIWLESQQGMGTRFFVSLPIAPPLAPAARPERWISREWAWRERKPKGDGAQHAPIPRVVLYDPAQELDEAFSGFSSVIEMVSLRSLDEVISSVRETPAHAVIIGGPDEQFTYPALACARKELPDTPVIGCIIPTRVTPALQAGADRYLIKPVQQEMLFETIHDIAPQINSVLIADDDPDARLLMTRMVALFDPNLQIYTASSGREALEVLDTFPIDLLLLDLVMPEADGMQVLQTIRANPDLSDLRVLVISAQDPLEELPYCREMTVGLGEGISLPKALECSLGVSQLLFKPEPEPYPTQQ